MNGADPRCHSAERIQPPHPLPHVSRRALRRVKDRVEPPTCCPYCSGSVELVRNDTIYGRAYGDWPYAYLCRACDAFVGLHPETDLPLGTLANRELREARKRSKSLWQAITRMKQLNRNDAYRWLAERMGIAKQDCHFGHFDLERCQKAFTVCQQERNRCLR